MRDTGQLLLLIHQGMVNAGVDVDKVYRQLGYDTRNLPLAEWRPRHELQRYFWSVVENVTADPEIGLHLCPHLPTYRGQVLEYLFLSSRTFEQGLRLAMSYSRLVSDALCVDLMHDEAGARIVISGTKNDAPQLRHPEICYVYEFMRIMHVVTEGAVWPHSVQLCCERRGTRDEFEDIFECPVRFGGDTSEIWLDESLLGATSPHHDPAMLALHRGHADALLESLAQQDLVDDIQDRLWQALEAGESAESDDFTTAGVAHGLGTSTRRLRRSLAAAGTSFRELLKESRFGFARDLLRQTEEPLEYVAERCGFSEPSAFYRAFKEWAGVTPSRYRDRYRPAQCDNGTARKVIPGRFASNASKAVGGMSG